MRFILGNHEMRLLDRYGLAPQSTDGSDRPALRVDFDGLEEADLAGDGGRPCHVARGRRAEVMRYLQTHSGFYFEQEALPGAGPTPDGRPWCVVHAGLFSERHPSEHDREELTTLRRLAHGAHVASRKRGGFWGERRWDASGDKSDAASESGMGMRQMV